MPGLGKSIKFKIEKKKPLTAREKILFNALKGMKEFLETYPPHFESGKPMETDIAPYLTDADKAIKYFERK